MRMKNTVRLQEEISKNVSAKRHITTQIEYFCESEEDTKTLTNNIIEVLTKYLADNKLVKITYEYFPSEKKVEVMVIEHR